MMLGIWVMEVGKGIGKIFLNPLFYWSILFLFLISWRRIIEERRQFGTKIFPLFSECRGTLHVSLIFSIIISLLTIFVGVVISLEMVVLLVLVLIVVSVLGKSSFLSASYTLGITFLLITFLSNVNLGVVNHYLPFDEPSIIHLLSLGILMAILLFAEALLIRSKKGASFPEMTLGDRGKWIGQHRLSRVAFIPFFVLLPVDQVGLVLPLFPYFEYSGVGYQLVLLPFLIGVNYSVSSELPAVAARRLSQRTWILSVVVLFVVLVGLYYPIALTIAFVLAVIGREWLMYQHKKYDKYKQAKYVPLDKGLKVLALLPGTPGDRLDIHVGETIMKVNDHPVQTPQEFYEALQNSGAFFKLDIIDMRGEVRFITSAFYEEDHYELGIVFVQEEK